MSIAVVGVCLVLLVLMVSVLKVNPFLAFVVVSLVAGIGLGIPADRLPAVVDAGIGNIMGSLTMVIILGAMLGKLVAESGAARQIADTMVAAFGTRKIQWGLMVTGFVVGIPLFYNIGFVLLVPLLFSVVGRYRLPLLYMGVSMFAALSVTHGFLPPHPSPVALVAMFDANVGMTLIYGMVIAVPTVVLAGPIFGRTLRGVVTGPVRLFVSEEEEDGRARPGVANSFLSATLPVALLVVTTAAPWIFPAVAESRVLAFAGAPSIVMLVSLGVAVWTLGLRQGRTIGAVMEVFVGAIREIAPILLIIAGSGIFKQVMEESGVSGELAAVLGGLAVHPLVLGWLMAAVIRVCIGSATVAGLTAAGVLMPLVAGGGMAGAGVDANLMVLSIGAGSLMFSHINDSGFWMFKEYFGLTIGQTVRSWSLMETIVSVAGLVGVLVLDLVIG
ncbi:MAG: GntP family permease [Alistipes sp.]|jgi:Gnt-I system high-affinity gluconate transporter|nr:GntP family permease [Alistipes sp.]